MCRALAADLPLVPAAVARLAADPNGGWLLQDERGTPVGRADQVVVAAGLASASLLLSRCPLPLRAARGQISLLPATGRNLPRVVLCGRAYLIPPTGGRATLGATYDRDDLDTQPRAVDHRRNLAALAATDPQLGALAAEFDPNALAGRAALRATTPDHLPLVGPVPDPATLGARFAALRRNARRRLDLCGASLPGLWLATGFGSRGLSYAPLAAELLADRMAGEVPPLPAELVAALDPARFWVRALQRGKEVTSWTGDSSPARAVR
ncbi:MAG: hypothetical protein KatS3mg124_0004 [Porticoccaceae bacterium]|nr:MAG: hypothetical protein KatS3mg124_0004 [Porticoccaceae bacterium]